MSGQRGEPVAGGFDVAVTDYGDAVHVGARGELDVETVPRLAAALRQVESAGRDVTLDLRGLTFMDSSGINLLTEHAARADRDRFTFTIYAPSPSVGRVLDIAGVRDLLPIVDAPTRATAADARPRAGRPATAPGQLRVEVDDAPPVLRVRLAGELDVGTVPRLRQAVDAHARIGQTLIIDLSDVEFIDSMGLAALVRARHRARARGGQLQLVAGPPAVHAVFILTRLSAIFDWIPASPQTR
jgi:anti-sigma B factor antagonist